ncbi:UNVERIFIED_CONTAM: hypothetical protein Slati_0544000 [Sesamum latifolium]|uniref:Transposase MuDR plant domain-containing protein n=1 Tax=Sesamum latifolium TaxID=2727402 RepID=A0AAW2XZC2_9LAMI
MVMKRPDRHLHLPPPISTLKVIPLLCVYTMMVRLGIFLKPFMWGENVCKLDYVMPKHCCLETLNTFSDNIGIARVDEGNAGGEGISVDEGDDAVGEGNAGGEGDPVDEGDDAGGGKFGEVDGGGEDFVDSDYELEEDKNEEEGRGEERGRIEDQIVEDTSDSSEDDGEEDVVENDGDLDEGRDSEDEGPSNPVFNPEETYDPTFEIEMLFSNKKKFKKALQSYAIKSKRTVKFTKNDKIRVYAQCGDSECGWKMHAIKIKAEIRATNPGSTVIIGTDQQMREERFNRFYVCFGALKRGFKAGCRSIIGWDGCHLKGPHGGILLTAIGVDPNNNLFPIAYAVVNKECRETCEWFLIVLKHDLNVVRDYESTFMSDKQKGLMQAFEEVFPGSDHRCCVRHLHNNFKHAGFRGQGFKIALWTTAKACTVGEWKMRMQEMKNLSQAAHDWFSDKPAVQWSRSHFIEGGAVEADSQQPHGPGKQSVSKRAGKRKIGELLPEVVAEQGVATEQNNQPFSHHLKYQLEMNIILKHISHKMKCILKHHQLQFTCQVHLCINS